VRHRQRAGERQAHGARLRVRAAPEAVRATAEHLRARLQLHVDLEADHRLPLGSAHVRYLVGTGSKPSDLSSAWAARKSVFSENCGPTSCNPTGSPSESPHGTFRPGSPAMHDGIVSRSLRYIASGLSAFAPIGNATVGLVGLTSTSNRVNASSCS